MRSPFKYKLGDSFDQNGGTKVVQSEFADPFNAEGNLR